MSILGIIVNYRTPVLTLRAVRSLVAETRALPDVRIVVIDNASGDDSVATLQAAIAREGWRHRVELRSAPRNGGFGYGVNLAVRDAQASSTPPDYLYILNPDAEVEPGSFARMLGFAEAHPRAGLVGSHIRGRDYQSQVAAFRFPSLLGEIENAISFGLLTRLLDRHTVSLGVPPEDCMVDWVSGTSMLVRRSTFERIGLFDEKFFLYFEEVDFCRRAKLAGIEVWFVAGAPVSHIGAASTGLKDESRPMPGYWFDSRHRYFRKHHGAAYAVACDVARLLGMLVWRLKERALGRPGRWRPNLLHDQAVATWRALRPGA
jgi:N-acetylglucosaminyl-diphospho-decaprenol L-rhamnosyltransferase